MAEQVLACARRTFKLGTRIVSRDTEPFLMERRQFTEHEAAGLVRLVRPIEDRGVKSSASPAVQVSPKQTAKPSGDGETKPRRRARSLSQTPPIE